MNIDYLEARKKQRNYKVRDVKADKRRKHGKQLNGCTQTCLDEVDGFLPYGEENYCRDEKNYDCRNDIGDEISIPNRGAEVIEKSRGTARRIVAQSFVAEIRYGFVHHISESVYNARVKIIYGVESGTGIFVAERYEIVSSDVVVNIEIGNLVFGGENGRIKRTRVSLAAQIRVSGNESRAV